MTQTLSRDRDPSDPLFQPTTDRDPATPGDPLSRLRFHYGQCLSAEDFETEQRYFVLRQRLHNALLHGVGTVWGLAIHHEDLTDQSGARLICEPGLAIDPLGREIWVTQSLCLDLAAVEQTFWDDLSCPDDDQRKQKHANIRRAYVVLRYQACLSDAVPVIPLPCGDDQEGLAPSRLRDSFRLCLEARAPADPYATVRDINERLSRRGARQSKDILSPFEGGSKCRELLLNHALNAPIDGQPASVAPLQWFWSGAEDAALLLATLDLVPTENPSVEGLQPVNLRRVPDNSVRAVLPAVQALADLALGIRLEGPPGKAVSLAAREQIRQEEDSTAALEVGGFAPQAPFQVLGVSTTPVALHGEEVAHGDQASALRVEIQLSDRVLVDPKEVKAGLSLAVQLLVWSTTHRRWLEVTDHSSRLEPGQRADWGISGEGETPAIWLQVEPAWKEPTTFQVVLKGTGPGALMAQTIPPCPLAGVAGEVVPSGCGRDAHLFVTYIPDQEAP